MLAGQSRGYQKRKSRQNTQMKLSFRWYGQDDPVSLKEIRQIPGMRGIVTALYEPQVGEVWPKNALAELKERVASEDMEISVLESIAVHEDIKLGLSSRDRYIDNYCRSLEHAGELDIPVVCFNFMPVFDWMRTNLAVVNPDRSTALSYEHKSIESFDLSKGTGHLPGWSATFTAEELGRLLSQYQKISSSQLWDNLAYFVDRVIPVASSLGVKMAIHPADPPWPIFGLPRLITSGEALQKYVSLNDDPVHGITFCTGSLGARPDNNLPELIRTLGDRIHFAHLRNVKYLPGRNNFQECEHPSSFGNVDMLEVVKALVEIGFSGPMRPDHGRMIWAETGRPGYGLFDRALGASYLSGLWEACAAAE